MCSKPVVTQEAKKLALFNGEFPLRTCRSDAIFRNWNEGRKPTQSGHPQLNALSGMSLFTVPYEVVVRWRARYLNGNRLDNLCLG